MIKRITSLLLTSILLLSTNVYAAETEKTIEVSNLLLLDCSNTDAQLSLDSCGTAFNLDSFDLTDSVIDNSAENNENGLSVLNVTENTPPVAGLSYMIANPDTMLNGSFTTDTIVYWLWSNGTTDYTYDPDGDEITGRYLSGINDYMLGSVTMGDTVVGFATKFTVAAQYQLKYYVVDEHGAVSDDLLYSFVVEAADGNRRPICKVSADTLSTTPGQSIAFNWSNSYDPDGDSLSSVRVCVYDNNDNPTFVTSSSKYYDGMTSQSIKLKFDELGTYRVRFEISDVNNNWSNWVTASVSVREPGVLSNVTLYSDDYNNTHIDGFKWGDYALSIRYANDSSSPDAIFNAITQSTVPTHMRNRKILTTTWKVSGYVKSESGVPLANETVNIIVSMPNSDFEATVITDSKGYFVYQCNEDLWYKGWKYTPSPVAEQGTTADWCRYGNYSTTEWMYDTVLVVQCGQQYQTFNVVATTGSRLKIVVGDKWAHGKGEGWDNA